MYWERKRLADGSLKEQVSCFPLVLWVAVLHCTEFFIVA